MKTYSILLLSLFLAACSSAPRQATNALLAEDSVDSFVDASRGFERLPAARAAYRDADAEVAGGADPRWNPDKNAHIRIAERIARGPVGGQRELTRLAYLYALRGELQNAHAKLAEAKAQYPDTVGVYWSEGWIRLNLQDYEGALVAWQVAEELHGGQPFWVPYTKAVALIGKGDTEAALAWWEVSKRSHWPRLNSAEGAREYFGHWRDAEAGLLDRLLELAYVEPQPQGRRSAAVQ